MPNLKDIRIRIGSVKTTRQVTSAMKMVSAAKFKKAHDHIIAIRPYVEKLSSILINLVSSTENDFISEYADIREPDKILVIAITSNRGLCGAFNSNVIKQIDSTLKSNYRAQLSNKMIDFIAIGKQGQKLLKSHGYNILLEYNDLYNNLTYNSVSSIAENILNKFVSKNYDRVLVFYNEFVNAAVQNVTENKLLPIEIKTTNETSNTEYIFEPEKKALLNSIIPKALKTQLYKWLLESVAAEHGARMTSMHKATDNATELLGDLQLMYNKARQTAITNEILEIVSGANALNS
ncbi:MAG: ATP synthase F1 subunit gamma [Marinilabiliaceae bacterium]|nr:ATP synthase F1 subunit gamma [Marinilabiliaceae bacterium]